MNCNITKNNVDWNMDICEETVNTNIIPADYVKVVRCKDCIFYERLSENADLKICSFWEAELGRQAICNFKPNDYCSFGERKK